MAKCVAQKPSVAMSILDSTQPLPGLWRDADGMACAPWEEAESGIEHRYMVRYVHENGNSTYHNVPVENVWVLPTYANRLGSDTILSDLIYNCTDNHQQWRRYLQYGAMAALRGVEGLQIFTTFKVPDHPKEERILHPVPHHIVEAAFAAVPYVHKCGQYENGRWNTPPLDMQILANARHAAIYEWKRADQMPNATSINPLANGWPYHPMPDYQNDGTCARIDVARELRAEAERTSITSHSLAVMALPVTEAVVNAVERALDAREDQTSDPESQFDEPPPSPGPAPVPPPPAPTMVLVRKHMTFRGQTIVVRGRGRTHAEAQANVSQRIAQARAHLTRLASDNTDHLTIGEARNNSVPGLARNALRDAEAELFDLKQTMPEDTYIKISNCFKRAFDQM